MTICMRLKKQILDTQRGGFRVEYAMLHRYIKESRNSIIGSTMDVVPLKQPGDEKPKFKAMYVYFNVCK